MEKDIYELAWSGKHGDEYVNRCDVQAHTRVPIFYELLKDLDIDLQFFVLECGCNKGHNLYAIHEAMTEIADDIYHTETGLEINKKLCKSYDIVNGSIYDIPWADESFDMTFTSGVLIHIPKEKLTKAMSEMRRTSRQYVMMIEYYSKTEIGTQYGEDFNNQEGVWSRPYGDIYQKEFPEDKLFKIGKIIEHGNDGWGFSKCDYWIFEKN